MSSSNVYLPGGGGLQILEIVPDLVGLQLALADHLVHLFQFLQYIWFSL